MPAWLSTPPVPTLAAVGGDLPVVLFNDETVIANEASQAAALVNAQSVIGEVISFGIYLQWDSDPGAFQVNVQVADQNFDNQFYTIDQITVVDPVNFNYHADYAGVNAKLTRFKVIALGNAGVKLTAQVTR